MVVVLQVQLLTHVACYHLAIKQVLLTSPPPPPPPVDVPLQRAHRTTSSVSSTEVRYGCTVKTKRQLTMYHLVLGGVVGRVIASTRDHLECVRVQFAYVDQ